MSDYGAIGTTIYTNENKIWAAGGGRIIAPLGLTWHATRLTEHQRFDYIVGASLFLRMEAFKAANGFDQSYFMYWEDTDLSFRLRKLGWQLGYSPDATIWHRGAASSGIRTSFSDYYWTRGMTKYLYKYHRSILPSALVIRVGGKVILRLLRGQLKNIPIMLKAIYNALLDESVSG